MFGKEPKVFRNSSLIYSDEIGGMVASMGFKGMLTEGAKHALGWKSPHYVYHCNQAPGLKLLLRDFKLSDDISLRFSNSEWSEYPLRSEEHTSELQSRQYLVCRLLLEKKKNEIDTHQPRRLIDRVHQYDQLVRQDGEVRLGHEACSERVVDGACDTDTVHLNDEPCREH